MKMSTPTSNRMKMHAMEMPMELVSEVFVRLPVKSLVRFRCVCKAWFDLISSSDFASLHFSRFHENDNDPPILAAGGGRRWMLISGLTYDRIISDDYSILTNQKAMGDYGRWARRGCSVNGLILLSRLTFDRLLGEPQLELVMWNPMIGKAHKIPANYSSFHAASYGFGYSRASNDYKVVAIDHVNPIELVRVYSLSTRTWRRIDGHSKSIAHEVFDDGECLIEGKIHFLEYDEENFHMAVFDVNDEEFRRIELPYFMLQCFAVAYNERIGLLDFDHQEECCNLWVMEDDRVPGSWHKLYTIDFQIDPRSQLSLLCFNKGGEFMLVTGRGRETVELCNVKSGERKHLRELSSYRLKYSTVYKESLVLL